MKSFGLGLALETKSLDLGLCRGKKMKVLALVLMLKKSLV